MGENQVEAIVARVNYDDVSKVTAVRIVFRRPNGMVDTVKGAAFMHPGDKPQMRLGIFEAILDACREYPSEEYLLAALRTAIADGMLGLLAGNEWEPEALKLKLKDLARVAVFQATGEKDPKVTGIVINHGKADPEVDPCADCPDQLACWAEDKGILGPEGPGQFLMKDPA